MTVPTIIVALFIAYCLFSELRYQILVKPDLNKLRKRLDDK